MRTDELRTQLGECSERMPMKQLSTSVVFDDTERKNSSSEKQ